MDTHASKYMRPSGLGLAAGVRCPYKVRHVSGNVVDFLPKVGLVILMHDNDQFIAVVGASTCAAQTAGSGQGQLAPGIEDPDRIRTKTA
jgi:hypothetical protein